LLSKGAVLAAMGRARAAALVFAGALAAAPPAERAPPSLAVPLARARAAVQADRAALQILLAAALDESGARAREAAAIFAGTTRAYLPEPAYMHYPGLPPVPFFDRALFPWFAELEAATSIIQCELAVAVAQMGEEFQPYIDLPPGVPVNQWAALNRSPDWTTLYFWRDGVRQHEVCAACPETAALIEGLPLLWQEGFGPTVVFSALKGGAHIPPHTGSTNTRAIVHLPLVLPGPARLRVGNITREWRIGEAWAFDDTIEHEAWNDASQTRVVMILDAWNPYLDESERRAVEAMMLARRAWYAEA
jgi:aspartate beta-hydroxylase